MTLISTLKTALRPRGSDERIGDLDSKTRTEIALDIQIVQEEQAQEVKQIDEELETAREQLEAAQKKAKFVQTRVQSYRRALDLQARKLKPPEEFADDDDEVATANNAGGMMMMGCPVGVPGYEAGTTVVEKTEDEEEEEDTIEGDAPEQPQMSEEERSRKLAKLQEQEIAWDKANDSLGLLNKQVREFNKRILVLQKKRNDIIGLEEENKDFVVQAAAVPDDDEFLTEMNRLRVEENEASAGGDAPGSTSHNQSTVQQGDSDGAEENKLIS
eukprot:CAMPEP_0194039116 /NCGR_PEP_ID=MMETSP0009_2-20130614/11290_1 /TAXON_ID=210454 /ORGANISM="Grammatophora oceanica, Strain CCMP 410" /LENGTH=271 /DNA_ID=CAMNT_0038681853 /DNA_START=83 /DNA_END=898 /DNA_ORIENTATION=+